MCDSRRVAGVGHGADLVEPLLVADGDALVLAEVFVPGGDNELFDDPARVGGVLPGPPGAGSGAAPAESGILQGGEQVVVEPASPSEPAASRAPGVSRPRSHGRRAAPTTAPTPTQPSSRPKPPEPRWSCDCAVSGSSAQIELAKKMNSAAAAR